MKYVTQSRTFSTLATALGCFWILIFMGAQIRSGFLFTSYQSMGPIGYFSDTTYLSTLGIAFFLVLSSWKSIGFSDSEVEVRWLFWKKIYHINDIAWLSGGNGWIRGTTSNGNKFGFSLFLPKSKFESKAANYLREISEELIKRKQEGYWTDPQRTEKIHGTFGRVLPWATSISTVFFLLLELTIWSSSIDFLDGVIASSVIFLGLVVGAFIGLSSTGWLRSVKLSLNSILVSRGFRTVVVSTGQINRESIDTKSLTFNLLDGTNISFQGLTLDDAQKVEMYLKSI